MLVIKKFREKSVYRRMRGTSELELVKIACEIFAHISLPKDDFPPNFNFTLSNFALFYFKYYKFFVKT